jgi:hypothetical protein
VVAVDPDGFFPNKNERAPSLSHALCISSYAFAMASMVDPPPAYRSIQQFNRHLKQHNRYLNLHSLYAKQHGRYIRQHNRHLKQHNRHLKQHNRYIERHNRYVNSTIVT